jgi:phosphatidylglycerophosphatase A
VTEPAAPEQLPVRPFDRWLTLLASGLGVGYAPRAPGTFGSLLGPLLVWSLGSDGTRPVLALIAGTAAFLVGIPICNAGIRTLRAKDPQAVVFDEIAAFFWVFLFTPLTIGTAIAGFLLFRVFDILKPWPIRRVEKWPGGLGVMADDALAGLIAGGILGLAWRVWYGF